MEARARIVVLLVVAVAGIGAYVSGAGEFLEVDRFVALLRSLGIWGPVLYVALFSLLEPFGVFGIVFVAPGSLVWDWSTLFLLTWLGSIGAGVVGFTFARSIGRDFVSRHLPERLRRFDERLATQGLRTTIMIRLIFFITPPAHWVLGLSQVRFGTFVLGTAIGFLPGIALFTLLGKSAVDAMRSQSGWLPVLIGIAVVGSVFVYRRLTSGRADG